MQIILHGCFFKSEYSVVYIIREAFIVYVSGVVPIHSAVLYIVPAIIIIHQRGHLPVYRTVLNVIPAALIT